MSQKERDAFMEGVRAIIYLDSLKEQTWMTEALRRHPDETPTPCPDCGGIAWTGEGPVCQRCQGTGKDYRTPAQEPVGGRGFLPGIGEIDSIIEPAPPEVPRRWRCKGCGNLIPNAPERVTWKKHRGILYHADVDGYDWCGPVVAITDAKEGEAT
jgi:hypothetical protein